MVKGITANENTQRWQQFTQCCVWHVGVTQRCHLKSWVACFYVNVGLNNPSLMPLFGWTEIANYFIATLGVLAQCCPHQCWVVMNCHVLRATLGVLTQWCPHQRWVVKNCHVSRATLGVFTQCCPCQRWVVKNCHILRVTLGVFTPKFASSS